MMRESQFRVRVNKEEEEKIRKFYKDGKSLKDWRFEHEMLIKLIDNWNRNHNRGKFYE